MSLRSILPWILSLAAFASNSQNFIDFFNYVRIQRIASSHSDIETIRKKIAAVSSEYVECDAQNSQKYEDSRLLLIETLKIIKKNLSEDVFAHLFTRVCRQDERKAEFEADARRIYRNLDLMLARLNKVYFLCDEVRSNTAGKLLVEKGEDSIIYLRTTSDDDEPIQEELTGNLAHEIAHRDEFLGRHSLIDSFLKKPDAIYVFGEIIQDLLEKADKEKIAQN